MRSIKNENGITLVALAVTIVVLMILTISITASVTTTVEMRKYYAVKDDVVALSEEIQKYYMKHDGDISELLKEETLDTYFYETISEYSKDRNPNDNDNYYDIDITYFPDVDIQSSDSTYAFNERSLTVYCVEGATLNNQIHYTMFTDFNEGGFAENYYSDVGDLPIISVVTFENTTKGAKNKYYATAEDTVTLKIMSTYNFREYTSDPPITITINGESDQTVLKVTYNGKVATATYTMGYEQEMDGKFISFSIASGYTVDSRVGEEVTIPTYTTGIIYKYPSKILLTTAMEKGIVSVGDFVNYSAGKWTTDEITALTNAGLYSSSSLPTSSTPFQFGGFAVGDSKDASITPYSEFVNTYSSGWRVLSVDGTTGVINLVHAGTPEGYYHPNATNSAYKSEYILSGSKNANDTSSITEGVTSRDWGMYVNSTYAISAHCLTYNEALAITGSIISTSNDLRKTSSFYCLSLASSSYGMWYVQDEGLMNYNGRGCLGIRPVVSLKDKVYITSGSGTYEDPWQIGI